MHFPLEHCPEILLSHRFFAVKIIDVKGIDHFTLRVDTADLGRPSELLCCSLLLFFVIPLLPPMDLINNCTYIMKLNPALSIFASRA